MNPQEVYQVLSKIEAAYSQFKINDETVLLWVNMGREMGFEQVMQKLMAHIATKPFPPAIAEIAAYEDIKNDFTEKIKQWEREGRERLERDAVFGRRKPQPSWL
ncbi:replicative helicase loader/inhibitor [Bacillus sp. T33-2]|uniref:replicative helicase loader/inhibitor n=1 Tax=Bacillus sp. T33-2 TaxID=2054168 RepID=UPI0015E065C1|nr:replicative helicase loader/inhibitor [Bacillus sp. T33-2]